MIQRRRAVPCVWRGQDGRGGWGRRGRNSASFAGIRRQAMDLGIGRRQERLECLEFNAQGGSSAAWFAEGLFRAVAERKGPIHRAPVIKPETVFFANRLAQDFQRGRRWSLDAERRSHEC